MTLYILIGYRTVTQQRIAGQDPRQFIGAYDTLGAARGQATFRRRNNWHIDIREVHPLEGLSVDANPQDKYEAAEAAMDAAAKRADVLKRDALSWGGQ